jgi:hypothetical protein
VLKYTGENEKYKKALEQGAEYYFNQQFKRNGQSVFRVPKDYPVEIHNQSQGIITMTRLTYMSTEYGKFAKTIAQWTIDNMQHKKGYFYYKKYPMYAIKIPFIRWSQAWMFLALTELTLSIHE